MNLRSLLLDQLADLFNAEQQLVLALPKMAAAATGGNLKQAFLDHLEETRVHVTRIEKAFAALGEKPSSKTCAAMQGLVEEGSEAIALKAPGVVRDVALVGAARRVEHYEMAAYQAARGLATAVDEDTVADLIQQTLDEEKKSDLRLCTLGEMGLESARDLTGDEENAVEKSSTKKLGKKKQK
ncbi:ferritin-like domain-containing protein [Oleiharenicola lentus]|uniref:ferritin-like domain-containing protein n=1 Tax=Oleiharenicola lentus TaxID=2508720 RepID=UPI003F681C5C